MRKLSITRNKSFVGCMATMDVYIENPEGDVTICGYKTSKLGYLPNGMTSVFDVPEGELRVFVIAGKMSKSFCGDFYLLPAEGDVALTGKNHYNPGAGNAYLFDGNDNTEAAEYRKKGKKIGWIIFIGAIIVGFLIGFLLTRLIFSDSASPKVFENDYFSVTLTSDFKNTTLENSTVAYVSASAAMTAFRDNSLTASDFKNMTLEEYKTAFFSLFSDRDFEKKTDGALEYYVYTWKADNGNTYKYVLLLYKTDDAFWQINFSGLIGYVDKNLDTILTYAKSITFK